MRSSRRSSGTGSATRTPDSSTTPADLAFAAEVPNFGRIALPVLFFHAERDVAGDTVHGRLADRMRADCADMTLATIAGGHLPMLKQPGEVNAAVATWLDAKSLSARHAALRTL